jgi:hypothetical protein
MAITFLALRLVSNARFGPMGMGRQRACLAVAWALSNCACQSALDLEGFDFVALDAGTGPVQTGNTLAPAPSPNDGQVTPVRGPVPVPTPLPSPQDADPPETTTDAGSGLPPETPPTQQPTQPPPVAPPATRPVLVSDVLFDSGYVGAQAGSERRGICGGASVMVGVSFYYYAAGVGDRLGFLAPVCGRFGEDPAAPLEWTRDDAALFWSLSDVLVGDPPPLVDNQSLGELVCPAGLVVAGARGSMDPDLLNPTYIIRNITLECAPAYEISASSQVLVDRGGATLIASSALPFSGAEQYSIGCDNGDVAVGLFESSGGWVDGFALSCTSLRRPRIAGDACSAGDACQSGVCESSGSCAATLQ